MELMIRAASVDDHPAVHKILMSPHVLAARCGFARSPVEHTRKRLSPALGIIQLVAEAAGDIVGFGELVTHPGQSPGHGTRARSTSCRAGVVAGR